MMAGLGYRIMPMAAPGVASHYPPGGKPCSFENAVLFKRFQPVLRTGGRKAATGSQERAQAPLVYFDQKNKREA